jgi:excinuclease UvrABC nuclease subunit
MLSTALEFSPERDREVFDAAPAAPAVFLLSGPAGEPYVSKTANLRRRLIRLLGASEGLSRKLSLRDRVTRIEYSLTGSDFESGLRLYKLQRRTFPDTYRDRLRLRPAPLIKFIFDNPYPRALLTTKIGRLGGPNLYYGPFPSRAIAEKFLNDSLDFFKMRRCDFDLNPDPAYPGCIYSEMKMCLAPCFKGCSDEEYRSEVIRVQRYLDSGGESLKRELAAERDRASAELEFEHAAAMHARIEKLAAAAQQRPEIVRRLDQLDALMVQPSATPEHVTLFHVEHGQISDPIPFAVGATAVTPTDEKDKSGHHKPRSMESRIEEALATAPPPPRISAAELAEHIAILKRWYYRTSKTGELFLADEKGELPMRRVVRGVSRVFRGDKPEGDLSETTRDYWVNRGKTVERAPEE